MSKTTTCQSCKKYDKTADVCTLEPFEGQYTAGCPEIDRTVGGKIGIAIVFLVITGVLWILHPILGTIALILTVLTLASMSKIVATVATVATVVAVAILIGTYIFAGDAPELDMQPTVIETPAVKEMPTEQPTAKKTTVEQPAVIETPVEQPTVKSTPKAIIDEISAPVTNFEEQQAYNAVYRSNIMCLDGLKSGLVLLSKKSGHGYATHIWFVADGDTYVAAYSTDTDFTVFTKTEHTRKYSNYYIEYVQSKQGLEWWERMDEIR